MAGNEEVVQTSSGLKRSGASPGAIPQVDCWLNASSTLYPDRTKQKGVTVIFRNPLISLVPRDRIELPTRGFSVPCSTD